MLFPKFDLSGRKPRDVQSHALEWLSKNWKKADVFGIRADTGSGKSAIGRAIMEPYGGHYITPSNMLLDQVAETYIDIPAVKGYQHYECGVHEGLDCTTTKLLNGRYCKGCPAVELRRRALSEPCAIFNPVSYKMLQMRETFKSPEVLVVDEAHALPKMALMFGEEKLLCRDFMMPKLNSAEKIIEWAEGRLEELKSAGKFSFDAGRLKDAESTAQKVRKLVKIVKFFKNGENYVWKYDTELWRGRSQPVFYMKPIDPPPDLMEGILRAKKIVLMSATLFPSDIEKMLPGRKYLYLDMPSPIPKENRPVISRTMRDANANTDPATVAAWIQTQLKLHPGNTIIHVSYAWAARLRPFSFYTVANFESSEKSKAVERFKKEGGVFLAAGCAEGLDLPYDQCRVNLIPILFKENIGDIAVKKRLLRDGGQRDYDMEIIRTTIQQTGRSTRSSDDFSTTVIGDPMFYVLMQRHKEIVPKSFREAIKWER